MSEELMTMIERLVQDAYGTQGLEYLRQRTSPAPAVQVPEGWKLVPVEATPEMNLAADELKEIHYQEYGDPPEYHEVYAAMLAAAPTPAPVATEAVAQGGGVDGWIAVGDRLPEFDAGYVLVHCEGGKVADDFFCRNREFLHHAGNRYSRKAQGKESGYFQCAHEYGYRITHWQPLPPAPAATKKEN